MLTGSVTYCSFHDSRTTFDCLKGRQRERRGGREEEGGERRGEAERERRGRRGGEILISVSILSTSHTFHTLTKVDDIRADIVEKVLIV